MGIEVRQRDRDMQETRGKNWLGQYAAPAVL
jgi:hypothetical protein